MLIVNGKVVIDSGIEFADASKHASTNPFVGEIAKEALHHIQPGCGSRSEVNVDSLVTLEPAFHSRMLVGGIVVDDQMELFVLGGLAFDQTQESQPLFVGMSGHASAHDAAVERVQGRKHRVVVPLRLKS